MHTNHLLSDTPTKKNISHILELNIHVTHVQNIHFMYIQMCRCGMCANKTTLGQGSNDVKGSPNGTLYGLKND